MLSDSESSKFLDFIISKGYEGFNGSKFKFNGTPTTSFERLLQALDFPRSIPDEETELNLLVTKMLKNPGIKTHLESLARSYKIEKGRANPAAFDSATSQNVVDLNRRNVHEVANKVIFFFHLDGKEKAIEDNILAIDPANRNIVTDIRTDILLRAKGLKPREVVDNLDAYCTLEFDPYRTDFVIDVIRDYHEFKAYNLYNPPPWRRLEEPVQPAYRGFIRKLMEHLIVKEDEREYVLDWCHHALVKRNQTILCLAGPKGTGKNILIEKVMGHIIGLEYSEAVGQAFLDEKFNAPLYNKRLLTMDEVVTNTQEAINSLKRFANDRVSVEKKGKDAFTAKNWASMAILTNEITKLGIMPDDRRYSVPEVTKVPLNQAIPQREIEDFVEGLENNDPGVLREVAEFGYFLLERRPKAAINTPLKGDYFYHIASYSMPDWLHILFDYLHEKGEAGVPVFLQKTLGPLARKYKAYLPTTSKGFESVLISYKFQGKYSIGEVAKVPMGDGSKNPSRAVSAVIPSEEFLKALREDRAYRASKADEEAAPKVKVGNVDWADSNEVDDDDDDLKAEDVL